MSKNIIVGIFGGGQLGMMLCEAAKKLKVRTHIFCPDTNAPAQFHSDFFTNADYMNEDDVLQFEKSVDFITYEFENIPLETINSLANKSKIRPGKLSLEKSQDRLLEKRFLDSLNIKIAPYIKVTSPEDISRAQDQFGESILKTRTLGYDGKGQIKIKKTIDPIFYFKEIKSKSIIEKRIDFKFEISQIIARDSYGNIAIYPIVRNIHENHILKHTFAPAALEEDLVTKVQEISRIIIKGLNHVGVLSIEFFVTKGDVLVNEIAPRVHNSGHWTIEGCSVSQFEQHLRCVIDEEVLDPSFLFDAHMINIIGDEIADWNNKSEESNEFVHLYKKKDIKDGRKMGHVTYIYKKGKLPKKL